MLENIGAMLKGAMLENTPSSSSSALLTARIDARYRQVNPLQARVEARQAKSSSSKKGPQSIEGFTVGDTVQVHQGTYQGRAGKIIRFSPNNLQTARISIAGTETPFLKLAFMSLEGEETTPTKKSSCNQVERHGISRALTEKRKATLDGWYNEKCTTKHSI